MIRNCTGCNNKHEYPWGPNKCKNLHSDMATPDSPNKKMASVNRDDPSYISTLEEAIIAAHSSHKEDTKVLKELSDRMQQLELRAKGEIGQSTLSSAGQRFQSTPWTGQGDSAVGRGIPTPGHSTMRPTTPGTGRGILSTTTRFFPQTGFPTNTTAGGMHSGAASVGDSVGPLPGQQSSFVNPAPADVITAPLTSVLQQLSNAIDPTSAVKSKGMQLRPEYYIQHVDQGVQIKSLDHTKLTYRELISGMGRVMIYLVHTGGEIITYMQHFNFIAAQAHKNNFTDQAFVCYEREVTDKVIRNNCSGPFQVGDMLAVASNLHAGNLLINKRAFKPNGPQRFKKSQGSDQSDKEFMPEGFPDDICYNYNYRSCYGKCSKSHICRLCKGKHKASGCRKDDKAEKKP